MYQSIMENVSFGGMDHLGHAGQPPKKVSVKNAIAVPAKCASMRGEGFASVRSLVSVCGQGHYDHQFQKRSYDRSEWGSDRADRLRCLTHPIQKAAAHFW